MTDDAPEFKSLEELANFISINPEGLYLEYKASAALRSEDKPVTEMSVDVSAFANAAGGRIIYGVSEDKQNKKFSLDASITDPRITPEWVQQVLNSNIEPRIPGISVRTVPANAKSNFVIVVDIPVGHTAHQAKDKRYYRRFGLEKQAMYDHEIRDVMARSTTPRPFVVPLFGHDKAMRLKYDSDAELSVAFPLRVRIGNESNAPAQHVLVEIGIDEDLNVASRGNWHLSRTRIAKFPKIRFFAIDVGVHKGLPIFKESQRYVTDNADIHLNVKSQHLNSTLFRFCTIVRTPGFEKEEWWIAETQAGSIELKGPFDWKDNVE